jgi:sec-independent protein translocase protein TatA
LPGFLGGPELLIVLVIILLLFGAKRIPELARGLGTGMREFRKGTSGSYEKDELEGEKDREEEIGSGERSITQVSDR